MVQGTMNWALSRAGSPLVLVEYPSGETPSTLTRGIDKSDRTTVRSL